MSLHRRHSREAALGIMRPEFVPSMLQNIEIRVVEGFDGLTGGERLAWKVLFERQPNPTPFQSLSWNEAWWKVFGRSSGWMTKDAIILVMSLKGEIIAFFPMFRATLSFLGIPLLRYIKPMGSDANLTEVRTGVVVEGRERDAFAAFLDYFTNIDQQWELVNTPALPVGMANVRDLLSVEHLTAPVDEGFIIALGLDWSAFHRGLKRNTKEAIRKCYNSLKRDGIEPVFICFSDSAAIQNMLPEFYRLHCARAQKSDGVHHPDHFASKKSRAFMGLMASDPENSGLRLFVLKDGDRLIAARLAFETPGGTYLYYSGYDPEYGRYSIMTRLLVEVLKRSIACGQRYVHLSFGCDLSKTRWSPRQVSYKHDLIIRDTLRGRLFGALYRAIQKRRKKGSDSTAQWFQLNSS